MNKPYTYSNDLNDFKMPYKIYGKTDLENLKTKYLSLTNRPTKPTQRRFILFE
ncbi:hypothetical protein NIES4101_46260 [Calothrix sp. NIES-4101]|nr:hypothetical protein NIES4101_46260 [Calothrix sp. NIES-4101]